MPPPLQADEAAAGATDEGQGGGRTGRTPGRSGRRKSRRKSRRKKGVLQ